MNTSKEWELLLCRFEVNMRGSINLGKKILHSALLTFLNLLHEEPVCTLDLNAIASCFIHMVFLLYMALWLTSACKCTYSRAITSPVSGGTFNRKNSFLVQWNKWFLCPYVRINCFLATRIVNAAEQSPSVIHKRQKKNKPKQKKTLSYKYRYLVVVNIFAVTLLITTWYAHIFSAYIILQRTSIVEYIWYNIHIRKNEQTLSHNSADST